MSQVETGGKMVKWVKRFSVALAVTLFSANATAAVPNYFVTEHITHKEINLNACKMFEDMARARRMATLRYIPGDVRSGDDSSRVASRFLTHNVNLWIKDSGMEDDSWVQAVNSLDETVNTEISMTGADNSKHKINFSVKAAETKAFVRYEGNITAQLSYEVSGNRINLEVTKKLSRNSQLVVSHTDDNLEVYDRVAFRISW